MQITSALFANELLELAQLVMFGVELGQLLLLPLGGVVIIDASDVLDDGRLRPAAAPLDGVEHSIGRAAQLVDVAVGGRFQVVGSAGLVDPAGSHRSHWWVDGRRSVGQLRQRHGRLLVVASVLLG